jgi:hypothetical protein
VIAYSYDEVTKEYSGEYRCQPDPLDGGFLLPAFATEIKPEQPKEGHVMVFKGEGWVEVIDYRGVVFNKDSKESEEWELLDELPPYLTKIAPQLHDEWDEEKEEWVGHEDYIKKQLEREEGYDFKRRKSYPPLFEQLDALYWDMKNGTDNWIKSRDKVKEQFPKEE